MTVKVSAIVSAYKAELYIKARLENLLEQSEKPDIIVVCQDGSIEHKIAFEYPVKIIITEDIPSLPAAWNLAIKKSRADYITNANCDDILYPGALKTLADILDKSGAAVAFSEVDIQEPGKKPQQWKRNLLQEGIIQEVFDLISRRCTIGPMPMWRRDLHKTYGYFDESKIVVADYDWWLRLASRNEKFYYHPKPLGIYLRRADSLENANKPHASVERKEVRKKYENWYKSSQSQLCKTSGG